MNHQSDRNAAIIKCSLLGILMNIILFIAKIILAGTIRSQAIMLDALNGIADMFSASVAIVSVKAANRKADRNHPFGYGRLEYLLSLGITAFVLYTAVRAVIHSVDDLIHPGPAPDYSIISAVLMCVSFILKIIYGIHAKKVGTKVNSFTITGNLFLSARSILKSTKK